MEQSNVAIKTVTQANLAEHVAERTVQNTSELQTPEAMTAAISKVAESKAKADTPVLEAKETKPNVSGNPDPGEQEPTAKKKNPVQPRIDELTQQKRDLEEFAESEYEMRLRAEKRIGDLEAELKTKNPEPVVKVEEEIEPDPEKYTDQKEFLKDWGKWNRSQALKEFNAEQAKAQARVAEQQQNDRLAAQISTAREELPDFDEVIESGRQVVVPKHIKAAIVESDVGAYLAYALRKDPELEKRIYAMTPAKALLELGAIALKYNTKETSKTETPVVEVKKSNAPNPPPKLNGSESGIVRTDLAQPMSFKDYKNARFEQLRSRRR